MKTRSLIMALAGLTAVTAPLGIAGTKANIEVRITDSQRRAEGTVGSARASADGSQYIGCTVYGSAGSTRMACDARDAAGTYRSCTSSNPHLIQAARAVRTHASSSMLVFTWDEHYVCKTLDVANGSLYLPTYQETAVPTCSSWVQLNINGCDSSTRFSSGDPICSTSSSSVTLKVAGTNVPTEMSFYNVPAYETYCSSLTGTEQGWSTPEKFSSSRLWTLTGGAGDKKVCVRLKNSIGWGTACGGGIHYTP